MPQVLTQNGQDTCSAVQEEDSSAAAQLLASFAKSQTRQGRSPETIATYGRLLREAVAWLADEGLTVRDASLRDFERFQVYLKRDRNLSAGRCQLYVAVLRSFYKWCDDERLILTNPTECLRYPKSPKRLNKDVLTPAELRRMLEYAATMQPWMHMVVRLLVLSGLRYGEVIGLNLQDIDLPSREIIIRKSKGNKQRLVFIDKTTRTVLAAYLVQTRPRHAGDDQVALLVDKHGKRLNRYKVYGAASRCAQHARIQKKIGPHSLRRTFATLMTSPEIGASAHGMNLKVVAELLGHARLGTTAKYAQVTPTALATAYHLAHPLGHNTGESTESDDEA